jgi:hypothetical protein
MRREGFVRFAAATGMRQRARVPRAPAACVALASLLAALAACAPAAAAETGTEPYFRIFLTDGSTLTAYGDFALVGDRVVFSLPLGRAGDEPLLHLASVPADRVDWPATERYREATRAALYAATRGDEDFAVLSARVAGLLNDIVHAPDAAARLALATEARRLLASWPQEHFGHRAGEVAQILGLVDEVVSSLQAAAGASSFDLSLVAGAAGPPPVTPLPPPTLQESILQALSAASLSATPAERLALLEASAGTLDAHAASLPAAWVEAMRGRVGDLLAREREAQARFAALRDRLLASAGRFVARADVRGVERLLRVARADLAAYRPDRAGEVQALIDALEARLDAARRLRLARDRWALKAPALRAYGDAVARPLGELARARNLLDDIRTLAGPGAAGLATLERRLRRAGQALAAIRVPADVEAAHAVLQSAWRLASSAARLRREAVASGDMRRAWDASAAAAGALMLLDRARADVERLLQPPDVP